MTKKVLMVASVPSMIGQFNMNNIQILQQLGYSVDVACNFCDLSVWTYDKITAFKSKLQEIDVDCYQINLSRSPFNFKMHFESFKQLKNLIEKHEYTFVHTHTPITSALTRIVCHKFNIKIIYTAHGFHFFRGGPKINWLIYYPIEKILSKYTDVLITINDEDYQLAMKKFKPSKIFKVPGVGVNTRKFDLENFDRRNYRSELNISDQDFLILSIGELCDRKNHSVIVKAIYRLNDTTIKYFIVGKGEYKEHLKNLINKLEMNEQVFLLGYRNDIPEICNCSDLFAFPSKREGLGLAAIEAMATGIPIITSNVNGIKDYSKNGITGYCFNPRDIRGFASGIEKIKNNLLNRNLFGKTNKEISKTYDIDIVNKSMKDIYSSF